MQRDRPRSPPITASDWVRLLPRPRDWASLASNIRAEPDRFHRRQGLMTPASHGGPASDRYLRLWDWVSFASSIRAEPDRFLWRQGPTTPASRGGLGPLAIYGIGTGCPWPQAHGPSSTASTDTPAEPDRRCHLWGLKSPPQARGPSPITTFSRGLQSRSESAGHTRRSQPTRARALALRPGPIPIAPALDPSHPASLAARPL